MSQPVQWVEIPHPGGSQRGYLALPEAGPVSGMSHPGVTHPGVVVIQEIFGVNEHIQSVARRLAQAGYVALAPDMFWRVEPGFTAGYTPDTMEKCRGRIAATPLETHREDLSRALAWLGRHPAVAGKKVGLMGFCWGGLMTYLTAQTKAGVGGQDSPQAVPHAAAAFYGRRTDEFIAQADQIRCPIQFHFGEQDPIIPPAAIEVVRQALPRMAQAQLFTYPQAGHGFHCDARADYHPPSAALAWQRTLDLFSRHLR
ncbi:MAG: dienelactone hydrolase family protein [Deltaproteobacteria bacterium]|nr:dienelactone hydrolase family protein [Deltaproteobacteria bacterium]